MKKAWILFCCATIALWGEEKDPVQQLVLERSLCAGSLFEAKAKVEEGNLLLSPLSISTSLSLLYMGARGETADEIAEVLHTNLKASQLKKNCGLLYKDLQKMVLKKGGAYQLVSALFVDQDVFLLSSFKGEIEGALLGQVQRLNFSEPESARTKINGWIEKQTEGNISELVTKDAINPATRLIVANALFLKGKWRSPFDKEKTRAASFYVSDTKTQSVPMMEGVLKTGYFENDLLQMVALNFEDLSASCLFILPKSTENLSLCEREFPLSFREWYKGLEEKNVAVKIPKCSLRHRLDLQPLFKQLGASSLFTTQANFSGIDGKLDLYVSQMVTEALLVFNEEGLLVTEASQSNMGLKDLISQAAFCADRPFLVVVLDDKRGETLFLGRFVTPL